MDDRFRELDDERNLALRTNDALTYAVLCDYLAFVRIEDPVLYERGLENTGYQSLRQRYTDEDCRHERILRFRGIGGKYDQNRFNQPNRKRKLILECFPGKFGKEEDQQDISHYTVPQIGTLFLNLYKEYA